MSTARRAALALVVVAALATRAGADDDPGAVAARVEWEQQAARLTTEVAAAPTDVDLRLRLALALAWSDQRDAARREAAAVLAQAPAYLDAELLLARLDAWDHAWKGARAHLAIVLAARPDDADARLLAADVELWAGDVPAARVAVAALATLRVGLVSDVDRWYREALLATAELDHPKALALARKVLAAEPGHAGARSLRKNVRYASIESATDLELYPPAPGRAERIPFGETITMTAFPRARWSATLVYEYRRRYQTNNMRLAARADWRPAPAWSLLAFFRVGLVDVVPKLTGLIEARHDSARGWAIGGRYTYDLMPWPGQLHRLQLLVGAPITRRLRFEGDGFVGALRGCGDVAPVWGARARVAWTGDRWDLGGGYGYGLEADRGTSSALLADPCAGTARDLIDLRVHAGGVDVGRRLSTRWSVRVSYGLERRPIAVTVHLAAFALRAWF